jgi:hypothetical protein
MNDPATRAQRAQLNAILNGCQAGFYSLPATLHATLKAEVFVGAQLTEARGRLARLGALSDTTAALAEEVVEAATADKPLADLPERIAQAEAAERLARLEVSVLELAQNAAGWRVISGTKGSAVIAGHLRPALAEVLEVARKAAPKVSGYDVGDAAAFVRAPEPVRRAWMALEDAATRYQALRRAQRAASSLDGGQHDRGHWFEEMRQPDALGVRLGSRTDDRLQPWPQHPTARLVWLATAGASQTWMPTSSEQDEALREWDARTADQRPRRPSLVAGGF